MKYNIIVAFSKNRGIGLKNRLPWNIPSDLKKFRKLTIGNGNNAVVMGKNTWNSLPVKYLKSRDNLILSRNLKIDTIYDTKQVKTFTDIEKLEEHCSEKNYECVWIIGGTQIYKEFLESKNIDIENIYVTYIDSDFECDAFFPEIDVDVYCSVLQEPHNMDNMDNMMATMVSDSGCFNSFKIYDRIYSKKS